MKNMSISGGKHLDITLGDEKVENVDDFLYLRSVVPSRRT